MNGPRRHHYLPQWYLEGFCHEGLIWVFDRELSEFRRQQPLNTAVQRHYYTAEFDDGRDARIEGWLAEIEGATAPIVQKLGLRASLDAEERGYLASFAAFMVGRVPAFESQMDAMAQTLFKAALRQKYPSVEHVKRSLAENVAATGEELDLDPADHWDLIQRGAFDLSLDRNDSIRLMLSLATEIMPLLASMHWTVLHSPEGESFVTTDNPLVLLPPRDDVGIATPGSLKLLPLSARILLLIGDMGAGLNHATMMAADVRRANLDLARNTGRFLLGHDETLVRSLVEELNLSG